MQQTTQTNDYEEDEINFKKITNQLIASKILIIIITLLFGILATYITLSKPPSFTATALIEIGQYNSNKIKEPEERILIESAPVLLNELNIRFVHKKQSALKYGGLSITEVAATGRLIKINAVAPSIEVGEELLNEITTYIQKRHEKIIKKQLDRLNTDLEQVNSEIEFNKEKIWQSNEKARAMSEELFTTVSNDTYLRINEINREIPIIDKKISTLKLAISEETANLRLLESNPELLIQRAAVQPTLNQIIHSYKISMLDLESKSLKIKNELLNLQDSLAEINLASKSESNYSYEAEKILGLIQQKRILEQNIQSLKNKTHSTSSELIGKFAIGEIKPRTTLFALLGSIIGMMVSIILVIFIGIFKDYKEKN